MVSFKTWDTPGLNYILSYKGGTIERVSEEALHGTMSHLALSYYRYLTLKYRRNSDTLFSFQELASTLLSKCEEYQGLSSLTLSFAAPIRALSFTSRLPFTFVHSVKRSKHATNQPHRSSNLLDSKFSRIV